MTPLHTLIAESSDLQGTDLELAVAGILVAVRETLLAARPSQAGWVDAIAKRLALCTPGPWNKSVSKHGAWAGRAWMICSDPRLCVVADDVEEDDDAEFIVHAPADIAALLAEVHALTLRLAVAQAQEQDSGCARCGEPDAGCPPHPDKGYLRPVCRNCDIELLLEEPETRRRVAAFLKGLKREEQP